MAKAGNKYADKIFSEHPIALWPLDEQAYYLSQIDDNDRLFSNWTSTGTDRANLIYNPSFETDTSFWAASAGATLARITTDKVFGTACLEVTKSATTQTGAYTGIVNGITAGLTYTYSAYVKVPAGNEDAILRVWVDWSTGGAYISTMASPNTTAIKASDGWVRISVTGVAPATARQANCYVLQTNTGTAGQKFRVDGVMLEQSSTLNNYFDGANGGAWVSTAHGSQSAMITRRRENLLLNPSCEVDATGWNGLATTSAVRSTAQAVSGGASFLITANGTGVSGAFYLAGSSRTPVTAGKTYTWSVFVRDATAARQWSANLEFYNAASGGTLVQGFQGIASTSVLNGWARYAVTVVAPTGATHVTPTIYTTGTMANGAQAYIDGGLLEQSPTQYPYFDGSWSQISWGGTLHNITAAWSGTAHASTSYISNFTTDNAPTYNTSEPPLGTLKTAAIKSNTIPGVVELESTELFSPPTISTDISTFNINLFLYLRPTYVNWFRVGYRYSNAGGVPQEIISDEIPAPLSEGWVNYNETFNLPATWSTGVKMFVQVNFKDSTSGTVDDRSFIMSGLSVGQGAETTCFESLGVNAVTLPTELALSSAGFTGYPIDQYGLNAENGYYLVRNNSLLARNDGFPIIYGTDHSTKLYPTLYGYPSMVFPGKGLLHEEGRNKYYTLEMWTKIDPLTTTAQKILGPLDSNDGIYVKEGFITLVVGGQIGSYCVGEWYRPMLIHLILKESNVTMMINGEEVISIPFDRGTVSLSNGRDWWGAYTYDTVSAYYLDTISIFPYIVSNAVAKRRFVYGQGTPSAESIDTAYYGTPTQIDFSVSEYNNNVIYPDIARWDAGYFNNLIATKDYISTPNYSLPIIDIGGRDLNEWYDNNYIVNTSEYPDGQHPKFISFRPNQVTRVNLLANPSLETNTTSIAARGTGTTIARIISDAYIGTSCVEVTKGAVASAGIGAYGVAGARFNVRELTTYAVSAYVKVPAGNENASLRVRVVPFNSSVTQLTVQNSPSTVITSAMGWTRISYIATMPATAVTAYMIVEQAIAGTAGQKFLADALMIEESAVVLPYFDGSYADPSLKPVSYGWSGTAHASTSTLSYWDSDGINYTAPSYLNFPSLNVLNDQVSAVYAVFEAEKDIASDRTLISFVNIVNGSEFNITLNSDEVSYSIKKSQDVSPTQLFSEVVTIGAEILVGIQFDELGLNFGYDISQFFSSPSSIQVFVGGNGINTFEGKIYLVGFCNSNNFSMVSSHFYTSSDINESTLPGAIERLAQGIVRSSDFGSMLNHIASYTLVPEYEYGQLFLDISVQSEWEEYFPLSYFASYVKDSDGNLVYDLDMLQMNIGYTSIISTDVWSYYEIVETYATYAALNAGFSTYLNLQKNNTSGDTIDVSQSAIQSYVTFQPLSSGANQPISAFTYGAAVDANVLVIDADAVNTLAVPEKAYDTVFAFRDGTVVFPPKSKPFEDYAMVVHLYINQRSILKNPLKIRKFEITSKNFNYNTENYGPENKTQLGTRFGKKIYPQSDVYGGIIDVKWKNPYSIYKYSTPYIFTTKGSGIKPSRETYTSMSYPTANEVFLPINETGSFIYKIAALQMMVKPQFKEENASVKLMEIRHRDGTLTFIADKIGDRAQINVYSRSEALLIDGGVPSTTVPTYFSNYDGGLIDSSYNQYFNILNGPSPILGVSTTEYTAVNGTEFYNNGRYVGTLTLVNNEWSAVGISLPFELNFDEYESGGIALYGGFVFNNISYYQSDGLGIESTILGRTWTGIEDDQAVTGTPPNIWQYWTGDKWEYAYVLGTDIDFSSTPEDIYDAYMGTNSLLVDDGLKISMKQKEVAVITDATWSMFSQKPA